MTASSTEAMVKLYEEFKDQGFMILAFPCNQFADQNPGDDAATASFCSMKKMAFPVLKRIDVNGDNAAPIWKYMKEKGPSGFLTNNIKWNFTHFVMDENGVPVERIAPPVSYDGLKAKITPLLQKLRPQGVLQLPQVASSL